MRVRGKAKVQDFTVVLADMRELTPETADALYKVFDDGTAGSCQGSVTIDFHRQAPSFQQAVRSAVADICRAGFEVLRIETEESRLVEKLNADLA